MNDCYQILDLPKIPKELITLSPVYDVIIHKDTGYGLEHYKEERKILSCTYIFGKIFNLELLNWIRENIINDYDFLLYQGHINQTKTSYATHVVHADTKRKFVLNYFLNVGGNKVTTSWYKENGKSLYRTKNRNMAQANDGKVFYKDLEILESTILQKESWVLLNAGILHDVDFIETRRDAYSISLFNETQLKNIKIK